MLAQILVLLAAAGAPPPVSEAPVLPAPQVVSPYDLSVSFATWRQNPGFVDATLVALEAPPNQLGDYHLFHAARADLFRRLGRNEEAAAAYRRALELVTNPRQRAYLEGRLAEVTAP